ncbi:alpha/beta hydrolase [Nocardia sp. NPDC056100]|uniref:alpha/beta hydrolase n=1 Tax=Nocardia sp. NPDC056100 TaxID=3345712 RepID=UPI0035E00C7F
MNPRITGRIAMAALAATVSIALGGYPATADTPAAAAVNSTAKSADGSYIKNVEIKDARNIRLTVFSAAMNQTFPVDVLRPEDTSAPRPTLYLLNGAGGGVDDATWQLRTDALEFLSDKNINVVQIVGGAFAWYTDWVKTDPALGVNRWSTYLAEELPPLIDAALNTNRVNAIAGISMAGLPILNMAIAHPGMFRSAASYSGLYQTTTPIAREAVKAVTELYGGGDVTNMWGPENDPLWAANDPTLNAEKLRGTKLFISSGTGIPGIWDVPGGKFRMEKPSETPQTVALGGFIEANVELSTVTLQQKLDSLGIPATFNYRPTGTHSWGYWQDDLKTSWPVLAAGLYSAP